MAQDPSKAPSAKRAFLVERSGEGASERGSGKNLAQMDAMTRKPVGDGAAPAVVAFDAGGGPVAAATTPAQALGPPPPSTPALVPGAIDALALAKLADQPLPAGAPVGAMVDAVTQPPVAACTAPLVYSPDGTADPAVLLTNAPTGPTPLPGGGISVTPATGPNAQPLGQPPQTLPIAQGKLDPGFVQIVPPGCQPEPYLLPAGIAPAMLPAGTAPAAMPTTIAPALHQGGAVPGMVPATSTTVGPAVAPTAVGFSPLPAPSAPTAATCGRQALRPPSPRGEAAALAAGANPSGERRRKFSVHDVAATGTSKGGPSTLPQDGTAMPSPVGAVLPASYLPLAQLASCTRPLPTVASRAPSEASNLSADTGFSHLSPEEAAGGDAYAAGFAEGHARAVAAISSRMDWLASEWRTQQSILQQMIVHASKASRPQAAGETSPQNSGGDSSRRDSERRDAPELEAALRAAGATSAEVGAQAPGSAGATIAGPATPSGDAEEASVGPGAEARSSNAKLVQLQLDVSELLATNRKLRQENIELLREMFAPAPQECSPAAPSAPAGHSVKTEGARLPPVPMSRVDSSGSEHNSPQGGLPQPQPIAALQNVPQHARPPDGSPPAPPGS